MPSPEKRNTAVTINIKFVILLTKNSQERRIKSFQLSQTVGCHQGKDVWSKGEVVPLVQPLVPHVDCSEVLDVVASPWLDVVHGGCHHCVQVLVGDEGFKQL